MKVVTAALVKLYPRFPVRDIQWRIFL